MRLMRPLLFLFALAPLFGAFDPSRDLIVRWPAPDTQAVALLKQLGAAAVVLPENSEAVARACREAGILTGVAYDALETEQATRARASKQTGQLQFVYLKPEQIHWNVAPAHAALRAGQWPGVRPRDPGSASASESPWIDANSYYVVYLRGLFPKRAALLGYLPDEEAGVSKDRVLPYNTLEMGLAEAIAAGGNVILTVPDDYRKALVAGDAKALKAWESLARMARFLKEREFHQPLATRVAVAANSLEHHGELLNMMYRRNVAPAVFDPSAMPGYGAFRILVASGVGSVPGVHKAALDFAAAGGALMAAPAENEKPWWTEGARKTGSGEEFDFYAFGKGKIVGYREPIIDPAEFALDVIDVQGSAKRDLRLYNAESVVGIPRRLSGGAVSVELINYGAYLQDFLLRVEGAYRKATLHRPEGPPVTLKLIRQGSGTEIEIPDLDRFASVLLEVQSN